MSNLDDSLEKTTETEITVQPKELLPLDSTANILTYGHEATEGISKFSDDILGQINLNYVDESTKLLTTLNQLMSRFDKGDFKTEESKGLFGKLFQKAKTTADELYDKYAVFSKEIDKIFEEIKKYEQEIQQTNLNMEEMYQKNMEYYSLLDQYIQNAQAYLNEHVEPQIQKPDDQQEEASQSAGLDQIQESRLLEIKDSIEQRIYDLELAKAVSLQTAPQIKLIQKGNYNLLRKINSAFVITMPLFKQGIIQAITLKRQKVQMDSMAALDESTNKLLKKNAIDVIENTKMSVQLNQNSSVKIETLEESYSTILNGIREVDEIQKQNQKQRKESLKKLETLKTALVSGKPIPQIDEADIAEDDSNQGE
ncbi:MAG: toxic anion resistance protein [Thermoclostridium sp.]|nr:toxic anion resistance protein [Thermoclostridium sp.]